MSNEADQPFDGAPWKVHRTLRDGTPITVRALEPADADAFRKAFAELSPETRFRRFFSLVNEPSETALRYLTHPDQRNHVAIVAVFESLDLKEERGAGVARFVRVEGEPHAAEAAVTVVDAFQKRGVGSLLLLELGRAAVAMNVSKFRGHVLAANTPMIQILESVGATLVAESSALDTDPPDTAATESSSGTHVDAQQILQFEVNLLADARQSRLLAIVRGAAENVGLLFRRAFTR